MDNSVQSVMSTQEKSLHNRVETLKLLARLGYGTTRQIAKGVWGEVTSSTRRMANQTVLFLLLNGMVVDRKILINGERMVALTKKGVSALSRELPNGKAHARDYLRHAHAHRTVSNSVFIAGNIDLKGFTEIEIICGYPPADLCEFGYWHEEKYTHKIPDTLFWLNGGYVWVEVENCYRSDKDLRRLTNFLREIFSGDAKLVSEVWIVITSPGAVNIGERLSKAFTPRSFTEDARRQSLKDQDLKILNEKINLFVLDHELLTLNPVSFGE